MKNWISRTWFLALLLVALVVGSLASGELAFLADQVWLRRTILFSVLYLMALPVEPRAFGSVWTRPAAPLTAIAANVLVVPLLGIAAGWTMIVTGLDGAGRYPGGLLIACIVPCTLASAGVWTRRAGGNDLVAMATMLVTNGLCFAIIPASLAILEVVVPTLLAGRQGEADIPVVETIVELILFVVVPMALAQATRFVPGARTFVSRCRIVLSVLCQCGVLAMVFIGMIQSGQRLEAAEAARATLLEFGFMVLMTAAVHVAALAIAWYGSAALGIRREDRIAVAIAGSQKTLMVGLGLAADFGFSILPMIAYHAGQLILDTLFAERLIATARKSEELERDGDEELAAGE